MCYYFYIVLDHARSWSVPASQLTFQHLYKFPFSSGTFICCISITASAPGRPIGICIVVHRLLVSACERSKSSATFAKATTTRLSEEQNKISAATNQEIM